MHLSADIVVVGFGFAGGISAVAAHDLGRSVLIVEKAQYPGGLSMVSGGGMAVAKGPENEEGVFQYLRATCDGMTPDPVLRAMARGMVELPAFLESLQQQSNQELKDMRAVLDPGAHATYHFPGAEGIRSMKIAPDPNFEYFPWVRGLRGGARLFKVVWDNVTRRGIPIRYGTAMTDLVQNRQGEVTGIRATGPDGEAITVHARQGVILACGGFENSPDLKMQFYPGHPIHTIGGLTNTGDGIKVCQKAGAQLWHMVQFHGGYGFKFPEYPIAFRHRFGGPRVPTRKMPWIIVDDRGKRYMNECPPAPQDTPIRDMCYYDPDLQRYPRIPSFMLLDQEGLETGPLSVPIFQGDDLEVYDWSEDNRKEIERGWIKTAPTVAGLAEQLGLPLAAVEETVQAWNRDYVKGEDPLGRPHGTMMPLAHPPFYGVPVYPVLSNTQGGPVHDEHQHVMHVDGRPIPHLYAAGELGSLFGHLYLEAGNVAECFITGRIAAASADQEEPVAWEVPV